MVGFFFGVCERETERASRGGVGERGESMAAGLTLRAMAMGRSGLFLHSSVDASRSPYNLCPFLFRTYSTLPSQQHRRGARLNRVALPPSIRTRASKSEHSGGPSYLHKLRSRHLQDSISRPGVPKDAATAKKRTPSNTSTPAREAFVMASSFKELPLSDELLAAVENLHITAPTEVQCRAIPAVLEGQSVVVASHTGSGKTLAYMIPIVQCLRKDELEHGKASRPRRPRAVVLCPTRELAEQVFRVAKSLCHHARFRAALIGGGVRMKPQEDALNSPIDMLVGTPGRLLKHIEDKNMAYGDIKYVVLDEADTMFDRGFGPDVRKFLGPLRNRSNMPDDPGFQTVLVTATITKAVQKLLDEEFPGIRHIQTSTLHKKISTAKHSFIKLDGSENKLESLLQVLEPSLAKGERVMVFCNTLDSCRAVDHFLNENNVKTVNYHGAVPADERVEVLEKFKNEDQNCPALVCTDLAARGLDLVVDHVLMFDFPLNSIDYLHRTGRTARMGAKGRITSLVTKRSLFLAEQIEEAIRQGETLEGLPSQKPAVQTNSGLTKSKQKESGKGRVVTKTASKAKSVSAKKLKPGASAKKSPVVRVSKSKAATSSMRSPNSKAIRVPKPKAPKVRAPAKATQAGSKYGARK